MPKNLHYTKEDYKEMNLMILKSILWNTVYTKNKFFYRFKFIFIY